VQEEKPRKLDERTVDYGLAAIEYCEGLPRNFSGRGRRCASQCFSTPSRQQVSMPVSGASATGALGTGVLAY